MALKIGKVVTVIKKHPGDGILPLGIKSVVVDIRKYSGVLAGMDRIKLLDDNDGWYDNRSIR